MFFLDGIPELGVTEDALLYGVYDRGYKAGGANPPQPKFVNLEETTQNMLSVGVPQSTIDFYTTFFEMLPVLTLTAVEYGPTFKPEFVNSFEIGMKNRLINDNL